jgi:recombination protein RecT
MSQVATTQPEAKVPFAEDLQRNRNQIAAALPAHITPDKFIRTVLTAVTQTPDLLQVDRRTLFNAAVKCATDGLIPDGREAALVVFNVKDKVGGGWVKSAQYMPMVRGLIKLARQSGEISTLSANIVYENDEWDYVLGDDEKLTHRPNMTSDRGAPKLVYATVTFKDGSRQREVLTMADVAKARAVSKSKDGGPWTQWFDEMAKKTAIRRLLKYVSLSPDVERAASRDDDTDFNVQKRAALAAVPADPHREALAALGGPSDPEPDVEHDEDDSATAASNPRHPLLKELLGKVRQVADADMLIDIQTEGLAALKDVGAPAEDIAELNSECAGQKMKLDGRKK